VDDLAQVFRRVEGVHVEAVADFAGHARHPRIHRGHVDRNVRMLYGSRIEEGRHEVEAVGLAAEVEWDAVLPRFPDGAEGLDHLAEPRPRRLPREREAPLVVRLHLRTQPQHEAATRDLLQIPRGVRHDDRAAREGYRDSRAQLDARGVGGGHRQWQEGVVLRLRGPERTHAQLLRPPRIGGDLAEVLRHEAETELQAHD
jgi:hypothetical protein